MLAPYNYTVKNASKNHPINEPYKRYFQTQIKLPNATRIHLGGANFRTGFADVVLLH